MVIGGNFLRLTKATNLFKLPKNYITTAFSIQEMMSATKYETFSARIADSALSSALTIVAFAQAKTRRMIS
jgi:hypothetical protein